MSDRSAEVLDPSGAVSVDVRAGEHPDVCLRPDDTTFRCQSERNVT